MKDVKLIVPPRVEVTSIGPVRVLWPVPGFWHTIEVERSDLFVDFAYLLHQVEGEAAEEAAIAGFVSSYGLLDGENEDRAFTRWTIDGVEYSGDRLEGWRFAISELRLFVDLWVTVLADNPDEHRVAEIRRLAETEVLSFPESVQKLGESGDRAALFAMFADLAVRARSRPVAWTGFGFEPVPTLHGTVWAQFAEAVLGIRAFRLCDECAKAMLIAPEAFSDRAQYCSGRCRLRAHRRREQAS